MTNSAGTYTVKLGGMGLGIGNIMAVTISWSINQSLWWAFWHGVFGWWYVIYYAFGNGR